MERGGSTYRGGGFRGWGGGAVSHGRTQKWGISNRSGFPVAVRRRRTPHCVRQTASSKQTATGKSLR